MNTHAAHRTATPAAPAGPDITVDLIAPPAPAPATPIALTYRLTDARTGAPVTDVVESHERPGHLIVVRRDLGAFQHLHPSATARPGEYATALTVPASGTYILFGEFLRANGQHVVRRSELIVGGPSAPAALAEDRTPKTVNGVRVTLDGAGELTAGVEAQLRFRIVDARTGADVRDLQPYLGAAAHVVILAEDARVLGHTHAEAAGAGAGPDAHTGHAGHAQHAVAGSAGPDIAFGYTFPAAGAYKLWGQFRTGDRQVATVAFTVTVR